MKKRINKTMLLLLIVLMSFFLLGMGPGMMGGDFEFVDSEYDYLLHMIPHHEEAVENAKILREYSDRSEMKDFADQIIETQQEEIDLMKEWLERWYPDRPHETDYEPMMGDYEGLAGDELDESFLEDMIPHHMEAVRMSQQLIRQDLAEHAEVEDLAVSIRSTQMNEIHQMGAWLNGWFNNDFRDFDDTEDFIDDTEDFNDRQDGFNRMPMFGGQRGWFFFPWIPIGIGIVAIIIVVALIVSNKRNTAAPENRAKELLDLRYARGEISEEEYLRAKEVLKDQ